MAPATDLRHAPGVLSRHACLDAHPVERPLRVLHVHSGNIFGGIESMLLAQLSAPGPLRHEYALCFGGRLLDGLTERSAICHDLGPARLMNPSSTWRARRRLRHVLASRAFDLCLVHSAWSQAIFGPEIQRRIPLVRWAHAPIRRADWLERLAWRRTPALTLFNSGYSRDNSQGIRYGEAAVVVPCTRLAAAPPATARAAIRAEATTPQDAVVFVHVGRLERWKGQRVLLDAAAVLRRDKPWACWIVGTATDSAQRLFEAELRTRAQEAGITERVRFLGERRDVGAVLAAADVYCQPNTGPEPYGLSVVEAMLAGLPVIASGSGGTLEIASPDCARLVPPGDVAAVCAAMGTLLEHPEERRALGARAASRARAVASPVAHAERLAGALRPLVTTPRNRS